MKNWLIGALAVAVLATALPADVEAKRLGGGKSSGLQRNMPARTAPDAPPAKPAQQPGQEPAQGQQAAPANAAAPGAAAAPKRSWLGPLAGLAAGLGIAALLSHFGLGEGLANVITMLLIAAVAFFVIRWLLRRFAGGRQQPALATAGASAAPSLGGSGPAWNPVSPRAEPVLERSASASAAAPLAAAAAAAPVEPATAPAVTRAFVPAAFDSEGFARTAKMIFIRLQTAHDAADLDDLRRFTTPELFASLRLDLQERGVAKQQTDVRSVESDVLDVADEGDRQVVSVRFHGQVVEEPGAAPTSFDEVWHLVKPHDGSRDWAIAGIEQMA